MYQCYITTALNSICSLVIHWSVRCTWSDLLAVSQTVYAHKPFDFLSILFVRQIVDFPVSSDYASKAADAEKRLSASGVYDCLLRSCLSLFNSAPLDTRFSLSKHENQNQPVRFRLDSFRIQTTKSWIIKPTAYITVLTYIKLVHFMRSLLKSEYMHKPAVT